MKTRKESTSTKPDRPTERGGAGGTVDDDSKVSSLLETSGKEVKQLLEAADAAAEKIREAAQTGESERDSKPAERSEAISLISKTNQEVQGVLDAAEDAGEKIREEARIEARQLIEETRRQTETVATEQIEKVSQMTEELLGELGGVQDRLKSLRAAFDQAMEKMGGDLANAHTEVWESRNGADEEDAPELRRCLGRRRKMVPPQEPEGISEGARLLALQQLMAGVDADVIEERLTNEFGIKDPKPILDWMGIERPTSSERQKKSEKP